MKPFDQVATKDGRRGVVRSANGRHVSVIVHLGDEELFDLADLLAVSTGPADGVHSVDEFDAVRTAVLCMGW